VKGYGIKVMIMDRYGNVVAESEDGWDGTIKGANAMPGVYYYVATLPDETIKKGTIELVHYVK
jgi:gliding motility-associated-like protein